MLRVQILEVQVRKKVKKKIEMTLLRGGGGGGIIADGSREGK